MARALRILHLEDDLHDAELVEATLAADGLETEIVRVDTRDTFADALQDRTFRVILADFNLPTFDGLSAQAMAADMQPATPFIFLSGTLGEELAIERLKAGATDYVLKQRIGRLPSSVRRALAEAAERTERQRAEAEIRRLNAVLEKRVVARTAELHTAERFLHSIVENIPDAIFVKDGKDALRYVRVNRGCEQMTGVPREEWLGRTDAELLPEALARAFNVADRKVLLGGTTTVDGQEETIETRHQGRRIVYTKKLPMPGEDGAPRYLIGISHDITDQKLAEDALKQARLEAERANHAKSDFLSRMSHDLRTPLNAVLGFAQLLEADSLSGEQHESVRQILHGGRHLLGLINEVLDIARIEAGHLSLSAEPVDVVEIVQHAVALVMPLAAQREVTLTVDVPSGAGRFVRADRQRLNQVLLNLLSNGVKYTSARGRVTVAFDERPKGRMRVMVSDTGAGIAPDKLELLFTPFERLGAEQTAVEGTGLGLALARGLVQAMGGTIGVSSEVDRGSVFWIELPTCEDQLTVDIQRPTAPRTMRTGTAAGTVLYIEDNVSNVRLMERILQRRSGVTLLHAAQGQLGVDMARADRPGLILLDLHLPDVPGEEVLRRLWEDPSLRAIPVAVLSADATPSQIRRLLASGAKAYLTKPLDVAQVLGLVDQWLTGAPSEVLHGSDR